MPNWVTNILKIECDSEERIEVIKEFIKSDKNVIDFDKIIPMPDSLHVDDISSAHDALHYLYGKKSSKVSNVDPYGEEDWNDTEKYRSDFASDEDIEKRFNKLDDKSKEDAIRLANIYKENLDNYGSKTWYSWAIKNWGTKWNSSYSQINETGDISFDTAWSTPYPVIKRLSENFPDTTFTVSFADEDIGQNCGTYQLKNGEEIFFDEGDEDFAYNVKGWSKEDNDTFTSDLEV